MPSKFGAGAMNVQALRGKSRYDVYAWKDMNSEFPFA
jgi:hypothetical protein